MILWLRVRGWPFIAAATIVTLIALALPMTSLAATPSPAGATVAAACLVALLVPVAVGSGGSRRDALLESVSVRPLGGLDLLLSVITIGGTASGAAAMHSLGVAPAGLIAARAAVVYLGLMLLVHPIATRRLATMAPVIYLGAVVVLGRGEDIRTPAMWAWIAADSRDPGSWVATCVVLLLGLLAYVTLPAHASSAVADE